MNGHNNHYKLRLDYNKTNKKSVTILTQNNNLLDEAFGLKQT